MEQLGRYRPIAHLGRGGMADVHLAVIDGPSGSGFTKLAVVKHLREGIGHEPELVAMFEEEARILSYLRHPNIVQVIEMGLRRGQPFLAMEYLDGLTMRRLRQRARKASLHLDVDIEAVALMDVLAALDHAYEIESWDGKRLEIIHRDVTPHNVIVTVDGQVKVLDFGIAKTALREHATAQGIIKGKLRYMPPEQACSGRVERRTDVFSVGVMLWEAATGMRFWEGVEDLEIVRRLASGDYQRSPRAVVPDVSERIDAICQRALAPRPDDRYPTAGAMRDDLERYLGDDVLAARRNLGAVVKQLAEADRDTLRHVIEEAMRGHDARDVVSTKSTPGTAPLPDADAPEHAPSRPAPVAETPRISAGALRRYLAVSLAAAAVGGGLAFASTRRASVSASDPRVVVTPREDLVLPPESTLRERLPAATASSPSRPPPVAAPPRSAPRKPAPGTPARPRIDTSDPWRRDP